MVKSYQDLIFWQKSYQATILLLTLINSLNKDTATKILISQVVRSCGSIGANIAEGYGRYQGKEYARFLRISLGSANETEHWLMLLSEMYPNKKDEIDEISDLVSEVIKMLVVTIKRLNTQH